MTRENKYQAGLIKRINKRFPEGIVVKNDSSYRQGIPDLGLFLPFSFWATLETKTHPKAERQPNQEYYVDKMDEMSFSRFIDPENEEAVLDDLQHKYESHRQARISQSE